ncbi:MAG: tRNA (adenosine(37)-N6)-dimethylallyltransferase MiaA [Granulosicoccus sp.]
MSISDACKANTAALPVDTPAIFLMGATACGKTALSLSLARLLDAEIISVDSALVYRGMDIGTAKPSCEERAAVPHHLIDVADPWHSYSAAQFNEDANALINDIHARGKRALLVGGTMLYFKALEEGLAELPAANAELRVELARQASVHGWQAMHDQLSAIDPVAARRIHPNDPQRLQRALEVYALTGVPMSDLQSRTRTDLTAPPVKFALVPRDRAWLHTRIEQRFLSMVKNNFMDEMWTLYQNDRLNADLPAMRSVGYRQAWDYLDKQRKPDMGHEALNDSEWINKAVVATRQLAKRQLTWLRSMSDVNRIECDTLTPEQQLASVVQAINTSYQRGLPNS